MGLTGDMWMLDFQNILRISLIFTGPSKILSSPLFHWVMGWLGLILATL
jgi:hypothetical protein